jgi:hypothetical protein
MQKNSPTISSSSKKQNRALTYTLGFLLLFSLATYAFGAGLYQPGDTNDPSCGPTDPGCYVDIVPDQTGHSGHFLQTNGSGTLSWAATTGLSTTLASGKIFVGNGSNVATAQDFTLSATPGTFALSNGGVLTMPDASGSSRGLLSSADWTTFNAKQSALTFSLPLSNSAGTISIADAVADAATKGAATFTAADFNSSSGTISIDYTNGQTANGSTKGFLASADWTTFNNKQAALGYTPLNAASNLSDVAVPNTALNNLLPAQGAHANKFLRTNGTSTSWVNALGGTVSSTQIPYGISANTVTSDDGLTYDDTNYAFLVGFKDPVKNYLRVDAGIRSYRLGDNSLVDGGTNLNINDSLKKVTFNGASGSNGPTSFTGSGLNDVSISGVHTGYATTVFTVTIDGNNRQVLTYSTNAGTFSGGETITGGTSGATGTFVADSGTAVTIQVTSGAFTTEVITGGTSGATRTVTVAPALGDTISFVDDQGKNNFTNARLATSTTFLYGMTVTAGATSGHTIGDFWQMTVTETARIGLNLDFPNQQYTLGDPAGAAYVTANPSGGNVTIHGTGGTCTFDGASSGGTCFSDSRLKTNIADLPSVLDQLGQLRPVTFNWIDPNMPQDSNIGFIAQEVQEIFPQFVGNVGDTGYIGVKYDGFIVPIIKAIQELNIKTKALSSIDPNEEGSLASLIVRFLSDAVVSIKEATIGTLRVDNKVCVDDVCVTKEQFKNLLMQAGGSQQTPAPAPTPDPTPAPEPTPEPTPEPDPEPETVTPPPEETPPVPEPETPAPTEE